MNDPPVWMYEWLQPRQQVKCFAVNVLKYYWLFPVLWSAWESPVMKMTKEQGRWLMCNQNQLEDNEESSEQNYPFASDAGTSKSYTVMQEGSEKVFGQKCSHFSGGLTCSAAAPPSAAELQTALFNFSVPWTEFSLVQMCAAQHPHTSGLHLFRISSSVVAILISMTFVMYYMHFSSPLLSSPWGAAPLKAPIASEPGGRK